MFQRRELRIFQPPFFEVWTGRQLRDNWFTKSSNRVGGQFFTCGDGKASYCWTKNHTLPVWRYLLLFYSIITTAASYFLLSNLEQCLPSAFTLRSALLSSRSIIDRFDIFSETTLTLEYHGKLPNMETVLESMNPYGYPYGNPDQI